MHDVLHMLLQGATAVTELFGGPVRVAVWPPWQPVGLAAAGDEAGTPAPRGVGLREQGNKGTRGYM